MLRLVRPLCFSVHQGKEHQKVLRVSLATYAASVSQGLRPRPISAESIGSWPAASGKRLAAHSQPPQR